MHCFPKVSTMHDPAKDLSVIAKKYLLILFLLVQGCCPFVGEFSTEGEERQDPMSGDVKNSAGYPIDSVLVFASRTSYTSFTSGISARTDSAGRYFLPSGFLYSVQWNRCGDRNERLAGIDDFALVFIHPQYDTTTVLFVPDTSYTKYVIHYAPWLANTDTAITSDQYDFGPTGRSHVIPTITMKRR
jgi:hypothetical protein